MDIDAFFASVEQLRIPALRGRPVIVGSGVIATCSYEARGLGLRIGMPLHEVRRRCPSAVILEGDYQVYRCFAEAVWDVARQYACGLETFLDEAYGDATGMQRLLGPPEEIGRKLQDQVRREVGLPVSVGLASNRMLAKLASGLAKPCGVKAIPAGQEEQFLSDLPIRKLLGVGGKTEGVLRDLNVRTIADLRALSASTLQALFGQRGQELYDRARGRDVQVIRPDRPPRTISRETTFHKPTGDRGEIRGMLFYLLERAMRTAREAGLLTGCVELTIRYDDWKQLAAHRTLTEPTDSDHDASAVVEAMLDRLYRRRVALRHVGVVLSQFVPSAARGRLFESPVQAGQRRLHQAVDDIRDRFGHAAVVAGKSIDLLGKLDQNDYGFVLRTPSLTK